MLALAGLFVYSQVAGDLQETIDDGLRSRADDLAALAAAPGDDPVKLGGERLVESDEGFSQILAGDGEVIATTLEPAAGPALTPALIERARAGEVLSNATVPGIEGEARILARPADSPDGPAIVVAGTSTEDRAETLAGLVRAFAIGAPLALVVAALLGYLLARRSLRPVDAMRRRAAEIGAERSGERLPLPDAEDEIHQLGETLNTMLDRLEAALERERVFVADASHELRTPLAILRTEIELADRPNRSAAEVRAALRSVGEEIDRLSRLADDLLVIARADQGRLPITPEPLALAELLERIRDRFAPRAAELGREITVDGAGGSAPMDALRMEQALGNLVDNALRHGAGSVVLSGRERSRGLEIDVSDRGAGFADGFERDAFQRFTRADQGRTGGGAGLGLAIVQVIAHAHGGRAAVASGPEDAMTTVRITIPADSRTPADPPTGP